MFSNAIAYFSVEQDGSILNSNNGNRTYDLTNCEQASYMFSNFNIINKTTTVPEPTPMPYLSFTEDALPNLIFGNKINFFDHFLYGAKLKGT
jgi:hypothetical protein